MTRWLAGTAASAAALAILATAPAGARERYRIGTQAVTPTRTVSCVAIQRRSDSAQGIYCEVFTNGFKPHPAARLFQRGHILRERSDNAPPGIEKLPTMPYGTTASVEDLRIVVGPVDGAVNCKIRRTGVTCRNLGGHGFTFSRERQRYF